MGEVYCKDCIYICKPSGATYAPHPESFCLTEQVPDYVTGELRMVLCKDRNGVMEGHCHLFEKKETLWEKQSV
jgi:hypothetical protein